jgi:heat shock protein HspQ
LFFDTIGYFSRSGNGQSATHSHFCASGTAEARPHYANNRTRLFRALPQRAMDRTADLRLNGGSEWGRDMMLKTDAKYYIGQVLRHRKHPFRGVVFDVDAMFSNTEEWYQNIPEESRPPKNQPFYHLLAENDQSYYVAYVSEQNLVPDETGEPVSHPDLPDLFGDFEDGMYPLQYQLN